MASFAPSVCCAILLIGAQAYSADDILAADDDESGKCTNCGE